MNTHPTDDVVERLTGAARRADEASARLANGAVCTGGEIETFDELIEIASEAATALKAQAAEIERLTGERDEAVDAQFTVDPENGVSVGWDEVAAMWRSRALTEEARVKALEAGLKPFAEACDACDDGPSVHYDREHTWEAPLGMEVTWGDFRQARSLLSPTEGQGEPAHG